MKNVKWLLTVLFIFSICIPSFAGHVPLHGHLKKKQRSVNLDVPIKADIDETSKVLSLEFLEYIGEVRVSVVDANGNIVYEEIVDTQDVSSSIISLYEWIISRINERICLVQVRRGSDATAAMTNIYNMTESRKQTSVHRYKFA